VFSDLNLSKDRRPGGNELMSQRGRSWGRPQRDDGHGLFGGFDRIRRTGVLRSPDLVVEGHATGGVGSRS